MPQWACCLLQSCPLLQEVTVFVLWGGPWGSGHSPKGCLSFPGSEQTALGKRSHPLWSPCQTPCKVTTPQCYKFVLSPTLVTLLLHLIHLSEDKLRAPLSCHPAWCY